MTEGKQYIISGPEDISDLPKESIGKIIFNALKKRIPDEVINVDATTGDELTVKKLLEDSVRLTTVLKGLNVQRGDVLAIISENLVIYPVPMVTGFYMGVTVNLLNPSYAEGELKHALQLSKPKVIFCSENALRLALSVKEKLPFIETLLLMGPRSNSYPDVRNFEDLIETVTVNIEQFRPEEFDYSQQDAIILLSSGTTGIPKGVLMTHKNLRTILITLSHPRYDGFVDKQTVVHVVPFFHLLGTTVQSAAILYRAKLVLIKTFKPDVYFKAIQEHKATMLLVVPPLLLLLASPLAAKYDVSSIIDIIVGGSAPSEDAIKQIKERSPNTAIRQIYGLTELCSFCTIQPKYVTKPGTVGYLVEGFSAKVCDLDTKKALGPLEVGELCFKGPSVMKGYIGDPTSTKECFDEEGFFHTGDLGYYDEDGLFYVVDRLKELIKYKGFQVAPTELETLLMTHPAVRETGVIGIPDERAGQVPLAFVVRHAGAKVTEQELVDFVAARISPQKRLYGGVQFLDDIPKNQTGKILRRKLMEMYSAK